MPDFKEVTTYVPDEFNWLAVDQNGELGVYTAPPKYNKRLGIWISDGGEVLGFGQGPKPKDASKELYSLKYMKK